MEITVKCPNCYQQVPIGNAFCIHCGYSLNKAAGPEALAFVPDAPASAGDAAAEATVPYDGPRFCPNGHDVPDPSLGFCMVCGSPLVDEPVPDPPREPEPVRPRASIRTCSHCGYVCDDPDLSFCLNCGIPFEDAASPDPAPAPASGWTCECGHYNASDSAFCEKCGRCRDARTPEPTPAPMPAGDETEIPDGMRPLTMQDLSRE